MFDSKLFLKNLLFVTFLLFSFYAYSAEDQMVDIQKYFDDDVRHKPLTVSQLVDGILDDFEVSEEIYKRIPFSDAYVQKFFECYALHMFKKGNVFLTPIVDYEKAPFCQIIVRYKYIEKEIEKLNKFITPKNYSNYKAKELLFLLKKEYEFIKITSLEKHNVYFVFLQSVEIIESILKDKDRFYENLIRAFTSLLYISNGQLYYRQETPFFEAQQYLARTMAKHNLWGLLRYSHFVDFIDDYIRNNFYEKDVIFSYVNFYFVNTGKIAVYRDNLMVHLAYNLLKNKYCAILPNFLEHFLLPNFFYTKAEIEIINCLKLDFDFDYDDSFNQFVLDDLKTPAPSLTYKTKAKFVMDSFGDKNQLYSLGMGYMQDNNIYFALLYLWLAAEKENSAAMNKLAVMYLRQNYLFYNKDMVVRLLTESANLKNIDAMINLGKFYSLEENLDNNKAYFWLSVASYLGSNEASFLAKKLAEKFSYVEVFDKDKAVTDFINVNQW